MWYFSLLNGDDASADRFAIFPNVYVKIFSDRNFIDEQ